MRRHAASVRPVPHTGPMFRLIRLTMLLLMAFVCGVFYERVQAEARCAEAGGTPSARGLCTDAEDRG